MNRLGIFRLIAIVFWVLVLMNGTAVAQTSRGTLTGVITDPTGAAVVTATVTITHLDTNVKRQTITNDAGVYRFDAVDLGTYSLSVQKTGFRRHDTTGVEIQAAHTTDIDVRLEVGATSEVVRVEASSFEVELQTSDQVRGANFSGKQLCQSQAVEARDRQAVDCVLRKIGAASLVGSLQLNLKGRGFDPHHLRRGSHLQSHINIGRVRRLDRDTSRVMRPKTVLLDRQRIGAEVNSIEAVHPSVIGCRLAFHAHVQMRDCHRCRHYGRARWIRDHSG